MNNAEPFFYDRKAETLPRADLDALQLARLKQTAELAYATTTGAVLRWNHASFVMLARRTAPWRAYARDSCEKIDS